MKPREQCIIKLDNIVLNCNFTSPNVDFSLLDSESLNCDGNSLLKRPTKKRLDNFGFILLAYLSG